MPKTIDEDHEKIHPRGLSHSTLTNLPSVDSADALLGLIKVLLQRLNPQNFESVVYDITTHLNSYATTNHTQSFPVATLASLVYATATKISQEHIIALYARISERIMKSFDIKIQDESCLNLDVSILVSGGQLFHKHLCILMQRAFEKLPCFGSSKSDTKAVQVLGNRDISNDPFTEADIIYGNDVYAQKQERRRRLGLIVFICENFKLDMLSERIIHECVHTLFNNGANPEEEEMELLAKILSTVGPILDVFSGSSRTRMELYFLHLKELKRDPQIGARTKTMLQVILHTFFFFLFLQIANFRGFAERH